MSVLRYSDLSCDEVRQLNAACEVFELAMVADKQILIEDELTAAAPQIRDALFHELLSIEVELRVARGWQADAGEYFQRFPDRTDQTRIVFESLVNETAAKHHVDISGSAGCPADSPVVAAVDEIPRQIGRYRIEKLIGQGGFGLVYKAYDDSLDRAVAIKIPHTALVTRLQNATEYLREAKTVAGLDHGHIVPVYDVGSDDRYPSYVVSKYIDGISLATMLAQGRPNYRETAELVATIADALQYAHRHGLVHRDVKPGNILIDRDGQAHLADFGLALRDGDAHGGPKYAGTPLYMSPEQARGEGHRVDGRSDVFSLGVVLYEMLTGRRPFRGSTQAELLERVVSWEPRPLRQYNENLPVELERICLKAMSKRVSSRYSTAHDMAAELRQFLAEDSGSPANSALISPALETATAAGFASGSLGGSTAGGDSTTGAGSTNQPLTIIPKGLRSFDEHDADFFLELLPGVRDRTGLPECIRFWEIRIEESDSNKTFSVGLIYGPSGCGKSSLVKAGLLPRLSDRVSVFYLEADTSGTDVRLLHELRRRFPDISAVLDLKETLSELRHGRGLPPGQKVLIVLDQFEQWLSARQSENNAGLVQALRQCDGQHVQCIVMVRDDFWLAVSRLMQDLEIDLVPGQNIALVDLFDTDHALRVLAAFGRAYGRLPENLRDKTRQHKDFLTQVVRGLAQEGKVICVRLAIFAEMMKGRPWTSAALKEVGGTEGVGVTFLEETFNSRSANPAHRLHQVAAQRVLKALLPDAGSNIKGQMRSWDELRQASGELANTRTFEDLIRILDHELRLITPTEGESVAGGTRRVAGEEALVAGEGSVDEADVMPQSLSTPTICPTTHHPPPATRFYQLTHDYLVPVLRDWLTRRRKETRRGRAELRLEEQAGLFKSCPENRYLPGWWDYARIRLLTDRKSWSPLCRDMMRNAAKLHGARWGTGLAVTLLVVMVLQQSFASLKRRTQSERCQTAVASLASSQGQAVAGAITELLQFPDDLVVNELEDRLSVAAAGESFALQCALAKFGRADIEALVSHVPTVPSDSADNLVTALGHAAREEVLNALKVAWSNADEDDYRLKSRFAVIALHLGDSTFASDLCQPRPDLIQRTVFIDLVSAWHGDHVRLADRAQTVRDPELQSALCLAVGSTATESVGESEHAAWQPLLSDWYLHADKCGVHIASEWALRQWKLPIPEIPQSTETRPECEWSHNSVGMTMVRIPAGSFQNWHNVFAQQMPSPQTITLTQPYLMSSCEVSVEQYRLALDDPECPDAERPCRSARFDPSGQPNNTDCYWIGQDTEISPTGKHPIQNVCWIEAVMYCNWLSRREGLQPCYERTGKIWNIPTGDFDEWKLVPDRDGYRLPTNAEWEHACRASTSTGFSFGSQDKYADQYVVLGTTTQPCGSRLPNRWGLFDMHGNISELVQDWASGY